MGVMLWYPQKIIWTVTLNVATGESLKNEVLCVCETEM